MAKLVDDSVLDGALNVLKNNTTLMTVCSQQPNNYTEATSTYKLASVAMAPADFTIANGDVSGRKITMAAKNGVAVTANGTATHLALCSGTTLLLVTTITSQVLTAGNTVNIPAWDDEIADPT